MKKDEFEREAKKIVGKSRYIKPDGTDEFQELLETMNHCESIIHLRISGDLSPEAITELEGINAHIDEIEKENE